MTTTCPSCTHINPADAHYCHFDGTALASRAAGLAMVFKLIEAASERWRYVNGPHLVALVRAGAKFEKGVLIERPDEPMRFRFILQPLMAALAAIHDGREDARAGRSPYFMTLLRNPQERVGLLREGLNATARIILLGLVMDVIYQFIVLKTFYPNEALVVALLLAFVPYLIIRGLVFRVARLRIRGPRGEGTDINRQQ